MRTANIAGLHTEIVGEPANPATPLVVLLHGYDGFAGDLSPFATSFGLPFSFVFPQAPGRAMQGGRNGHAWWSIDDEGRAEALERGRPRDLSAIDPPGLPSARDQMIAFLDEIERAFRSETLIIGGFSQGAMLTCDLALTTPRPLAGLVFLSGARIRANTWAPLYGARRGLRVFLSHGTSDPDLSFDTAERFQAGLVGHGLAVTWVPFEGAHEIPLLVLRRLKRFFAEFLPGGG